jgi:hypothetical protein
MDAVSAGPLAVATQKGDTGEHDFVWLKRMLLNARGGSLFELPGRTWITSLNLFYQVYPCPSVVHLIATLRLDSQENLPSI